MYSEPEKVFIRCYLREIHEDLGYPDLVDLAEALQKIDSRISEEGAKKYVHNQTVGGEIGLLSEAGLSLIAQNYETPTFRSGLIDDALLSYMTQILIRYEKIKDRPYSDIAFDRWRNTSLSGRRVFSSGYYQIYRREKPLSNENLDEQDQGVACELLYVDSNKMECILLSSSYKLYAGTLHINDEKTAYILMQRPDDNHRGTLFRTIYAHLDGRKPFYPAIMLGTESMTSMPESTDCFAIFLRRSMHRPLYDELDTIKRHVTEKTEIETSIAFEYITKGEKKIRDFPLLSKIIADPTIAVGFFREPSRTPDKAETFQLARNGLLDVFKKGAQV